MYNSIVPFVSFTWASKPGLHVNEIWGPWKLGGNKFKAREGKMYQGTKENKAVH